MPLRRLLRSRRHWAEALVGDADTANAPGPGLRGFVATADEALAPVIAQLEAEGGRDRSGVSAFAIHLDIERDHLDNAFSLATLRQRVGSLVTGDVTGQTWVEVGPGTRNPYGLLVVLALLGADRVIGIDPEPADDERIAAVAAARSIAWTLSAPAHVLGPAHPAPATLVARAARFDVARLWRGDLGGLADTSVEIRNEPLEAGSLPAGSVDQVSSISVLEHVADLDGALAELARITRPGGCGRHFVDGIDHTSYRYPDRHPLGHLEVVTDARMVNGSNRVRPLEYPERFRAVGFDVEDVVVAEKVPVTTWDRRRFVEPHRSAETEHLSVTKAWIEVRRPVG